MQLMKKLEFPIKKIKQNRILFSIICVLNIVVILLYVLSLKLNAFDGYRTYHLGISNPQMAIFCILVFSILFIPVFDFEKINIYSLSVFVLFLVLHIVMIYKSVDAVYPHFKNSIMYNNTRFEIEDISLTELNNLSSGNHIVYIGRENCIYCNFAYDYLYKRSLEQPIKISYYNTGVDREDNNEEMMKTLEKYNVSSVPAVIFIVNGKHESTIFYTDIINYFGETIHNYKIDNIFFN